jgi:Zn-dependent M32 family carboxypeptidase
VTDTYVAFIPEKLSGWKAGQMQIISRAGIDNISVGSEFHTEYQGITSTSASFWTLTFETTDYRQFTRWLYLGKNEKEMNQYRPQLGKIMENLGNYFELTEGDSFQTSDGYQTSFGYGFWF